MFFTNTLRLLPLFPEQLHQYYQRRDIDNPSDNGHTVSDVKTPEWMAFKENNVKQDREQQQVLGIVGGECRRVRRDVSNSLLSTAPWRTSMCPQRFGCRPTFGLRICNAFAPITSASWPSS